ncbi:MAG: Lambda phage tail tape-measure protein (Tape meas lam C) [Magnetococcales bacterium]|nr:Lambda phage tail tape-measure protein (Tape meas lam C) [Magnetococcales bacterium]
MTDRQRQVSEATRRLSATATSQQRSEVERLAGALYDEKQAMEKLAASTKNSHDRMTQSGKEWSAGMQQALKTYSAEVTDSTRNWDIATTNAFRGMEDTLVQFVTTGKASWRSLVNSILADLARIAVRQAVTGALAQALGGAMGAGMAGAGGGMAGMAASAAIMHDGGVVGAASTHRLVPASVFSGAPRFHSGGLVGPDEVPIIAQRGERVLSRRETESYAAGRSQSGGGGNVEIQIVNVTNPDQIKKLVADTIAERKDVVVNMVLNALDERNLVVRRV